MSWKYRSDLEQGNYNPNWLIEERKKLKSKSAVSFSNSNGLKQNIRKIPALLL